MSAPAASLYDTDFYGWTQNQANMIRNGNVTGLDFAHLLEEIETMGRSEKRGLKNRLIVLLMHLLKWQYQSGHRSGSWQATIKVQRIRIAKLLQENPSLAPLLQTTIADAWEEARIEAERETGMSSDLFPQNCPWSFSQLLRDDFWPEPVQPL